MNNLIEREDAIKALRLEYPTMPMFKSLREEWAIKTEGFRKAEEVIMKLPSADRPQGEWFKDDEGTFICSACGSGYKDQPTLMGKPMFKWCPLCGARMKGADDE